MRPPRSSVCATDSLAARFILSAANVAGPYLRSIAASIAATILAPAFIPSSRSRSAWLSCRKFLAASKSGGRRSIAPGAADLAPMFVAADLGHSFLLPVAEGDELSSRRRFRSRIHSQGVGAEMEGSGGGGNGG